MAVILVFVVVIVVVFVPAPPNNPLSDPKHQLIETIRPSIEVHCGCFCGCRCSAAVGAPGTRLRTIWGVSYKLLYPFHDLIMGARYDQRIALQHEVGQPVCKGLVPNLRMSAAGPSTAGHGSLVQRLLT